MQHYDRTSARLRDELAARGSELDEQQLEESLNLLLLSTDQPAEVRDLAAELVLGGVPSAVYVEDPYPSVVEATFNLGISQTPLPEFLARDWPAEVSVRRLKRNIPDRGVVIDKAVEYALAHVDYPFDYTATATLPFKFSEGNLHCAEVAWRSYMAGGVDLDSNGGLLVFPDDIYFSPKLGKP